MGIEGRLVEVAELAPAERERMLELMRGHYENVERRTFEGDLDEKDWVIVLSDAATGDLCGFSTQVLLEETLGQRQVRVLFSGDTIVARQYWGDNALARVWGRPALRLADASAAADLYWFLICKGYKTYRFLPVFFHEFHPRFDAVTPAWAAETINALGRRRYPERFDAERGVVRASAETDRLRPGLADVTEERLRDPHVRFFAERNPGHARGDELCCIAPLSRSNFRPSAYRVMGLR